MDAWWDAQMHDGPEDDYELSDAENSSLLEERWDLASALHSNDADAVLKQTAWLCNVHKSKRKNVDMMEMVKGSAASEHLEDADKTGDEGEEGNVGELAHAAIVKLDSELAKMFASSPIYGFKEDIPLDAVIIAVFVGNVEIATTLLLRASKIKLDFFLWKRYGEALRVAAASKNKEMVTLILKQGRAHGGSALCSAIKSKDSEMAKFLLADKKVNFADFDQTDGSGPCPDPLSDATTAEDVEMVRLLFNDKRFKPDWYTLANSTHTDNAEIVELHMHDDIDICKEENYVIKAASKECHMNAIRVLLKDKRVWKISCGPLIADEFTEQMSGMGIIHRSSGTTLIKCMHRRLTRLQFCSDVVREIVDEWICWDK